MKKVTAVFIGRDGSCGYKHNQTYTIIITHSKGHNILITPVLGSTSIPANEKTPEGAEYESLTSFLNNWNCITQES